MTNPDDQTLVASAVEAAGRAAVWFARAVVVALAGLLAALLAFLALVLQSAGLLLKTVAEFATAALPIALGAVPWLTRGAIAGATCYAVVVTWPGVFLAYSADMPALPAGALATAVVVCPIALAVIARRWGALLGAIAVILIIGHGLIIAGPLIRAFAVVIVMAAMAMTTIFTTGTIGETDNEFRGNDEERRDGADQKPAPGHPGAGNWLHDLELPPDHDGR